MLYSKKNNLAHIHIHKTAGTSFRYFLQKNFDDMEEMPELPEAHHSAAEFFSILKQNNREPKDVNIITIIRNPLDHVVSIYNYWRSSRYISNEEKKLPHIQLANQLQFGDFVKKLVQNVNYIPFAPLLLVEGELPPNITIFKLETIEDDMSFYFNNKLKMKLNIQLPHLRVNKKKPYNSYYTTDLIDIVRNAYRWCYSMGFYE
jgi:hypothetical protein